MTQTFFAHFRCRDLLEKSVLDYDYDIECSTEDATWTLLALIAFVGITVVSIGFPMGVSHERSRNCNLSRITCCCRNAGMVFWMRKDRNKDLVLVRLEKKSAVIAQRDFGKKFNYIAGEFKPESYYAEPVDLMRKLMLTGVLGLIPPGTVLQSFFSVIISLFFLIMHVYMW